MFGSIPIVRNSTLWPLYKEAPVYVLDDNWHNPTEKQFLNYEVKTKSKKLLLAQYWFDLLDYHKALAKGNKTKPAQSVL